MIFNPTVHVTVLLKKKKKKGEHSTRILQNLNEARVFMHMEVPQECLRKASPSNWAVVRKVGGKKEASSRESIPEFSPLMALNSIGCFFWYLSALS